MSKALQSFQPSAACRPVEQRNMTRAVHPRSRGSVLQPVHVDFCRSFHLATSPALMERGSIRAPRYARPASHPGKGGAPFPSSGSTLAARSGCAERLRRSRRSMPLRRSRDWYVSVESLGRFSRAGGGFLFPRRARRLFPSAGKPCNPYAFAPASRARPYALTLCPPGFVLLFGRARPATLSTGGSLCAGCNPFPPHLCAPLRSAHATPYNASPRHRSPCVYFPSVVCRGSNRCAGVYAHASRKKKSVRLVNVHTDEF